jgi:Predicted membrane protein (DUF2243)
VATLQSLLSLNQVVGPGRDETRRAHISLQIAGFDASAAVDDPPSFTGRTRLLLAGWGVFNVAEGLVDHQLLGIHHVRDDIGAPLGWDLAFLAFGLLLVACGVALIRAARARRAPRARPRRRPASPA